MIISKPKKSTLFSLSLFLILDFALIAATFNSIVNSNEIYWYHYIFLLILIPVGIGVLIKTILNYKITRIGKGKIDIKIPARLKNKSYSLKDIKQWQEVTIRTATGIYQQLEIVFLNDDKLTLGRQEHSAYDQIIKYLQQKSGKKRIS